MEEDHVHVYMTIPPKYSVSKIVEIMKRNATFEMKKKFAFLKQVYWGTEAIWSPGFFVSTVGINEHIIKQYVENQGREDEGQAQLELV